MKQTVNDIVFLNQSNQVEMIFEGELVQEALLPMLKETDLLLEGVKKKSLMPQLLVNVIKLNKVSISSRKIGSEWIKSHPDTKIAVYGYGNLFMKYFVNLLIMATGSSSRMKMFVTRKEAQAWLGSFKPKK